MVQNADRDAAPGPLQAPSRPGEKSPGAFRTISEAAEELDLPQHVLRFWETRFVQIRPVKRGGGRRYYRPDDIELLRGIRHLLYGRGYTIKGVQKILRERGLRYVQTVEAGGEAALPPDPDWGGEPEPAEGHADDGTEVAAASLEAESEPALSAGDAVRLRAALGELVECRRVLAALRSGDEEVDPS